MTELFIFKSKLGVIFVDTFSPEYLTIQIGHTIKLNNVEYILIKTIDVDL